MKIAFREVRPSDAQLILDWRMQPHVARFMQTDIKHDLAAQQVWLESCCHSEDYYHWIIESDDEAAGLINIADLDRTAKTLSWGFYIGEPSMMGIGGFVPPYLYHFCFNTLDVQTIRADVFFSNTNVIKLHQLHGYYFEPRHDHVIEKNGKQVLLVAMLLDRDVFNKGRFSRFKTNFPMS